MQRKYITESYNDNIIRELKLALEASLQLLPRIIEWAQEKGEILVHCSSMCSTCKPLWKV
jgi:hypothetical protein